MQIQTIGLRYFQLGHTVFDVRSAWNINIGGNIWEGASHQGLDYWAFDFLTAQEQT